MTNVMPAAPIEPERVQYSSLACVRGGVQYCGACTTGTSMKVEHTLGQQHDGDHVKKNTQVNEAQALRVHRAALD